MEHFAPGRGKLKVTGILYIILGILSILGGLLLLAGGGLLMSGSLGTSADVAMGAIASFLSLLILVDAVLYLVLGILGVKNCDKPEKCGVNFGLGIVVLVLVLVGMAGNVLTTGPSGVASSVVGLVLAIIYLIGAKENKNAAKR